MTMIEKMRGPAIEAFEGYVAEHDMGFSYECDDPEHYPRAWDAANRAALLAALDAEDEALVEHVAKQLLPEGWDGSQAPYDSKCCEMWRVMATRYARGSISALRSLVSAKDPEA